MLQCNLRFARLSVANFTSSNLSRRAGVLLALLLTLALAACNGSTTSAGSSLVPSAPTGLIVSAGNGQDTVSWQSVNGATSYNLYWSTTSGKEQSSSGHEISNATSPYTQTGLTNGTTYYYVVTAVDAAGEGSASTEKSATPAAAPSAPTGVTATGADSQVTISWTAVSGATSYNLYWGTSSGVTTSSGTKIAGVTSGYVQTGLTNGTAYYYVVTAVNGAGESPASSEVNATPAAATAAPSAPTGVQATAGNGQVTISWTAVSGATSYNLYWSNNSGQEQGSGGHKVTGVTSGYAHTGLTNGTAYYYVVTAVNSVGESAISSEVSATPAATVTVPSAPTGVTATAGNGQVTISWTAVSGATTYWVYYDTNSPVTTSLTPSSAPPPATAYTQKNLNDGTTYYFAVTASNSAGESALSTEVSATPNLGVPTTPTSLAATAGDGKVTLTFSGSTGATSYNLYRSTSSGVTTTSYGTKIPNVSSPYDDATVTNGTTYYYVATGVNSSGESTASSEVSATPAAAIAAPTGVMETDGDKQVTLTWTAVSGAVSYNVYRNTTGNAVTTSDTQIKTGVTTNSYTDPSLTNGTKYYYGVTAVGSTNNESAISSDIVIGSPEGLVTSFSAGVNFSLAVRDDGTLWAWGYNYSGQLGTGDNTQYTSPKQVGTATNWKMVSAGYDHTLAIKTDGTLWAWGNNDCGQLGDGTTTSQNAPKEVSSATTWSAISAGDGFSAALKTDGTLYTWGSNSSGELGIGSTSPDLCANTGNGNQPASLNPVQVTVTSPSITTWKVVDASNGSAFVLAIASDGTLWGWGDDTDDQLGNNNTAQQPSPLEIDSGTSWATVTTGSIVGLALKSDGTLWAWGYNQVGQLGDGNSLETLATPTQIGTDTDWSVVSTGGGATFGIKSNGALYVWGAGYLGDGGYTLSTGYAYKTPTQLGTLTTWTAFDNSPDHTLATQTNKILQAWGSNTNGQLGDGSTNTGTSPKNVPIP